MLNLFHYEHLLHEIFQQLGVNLNILFKVSSFHFISSEVSFIFKDGSLKKVGPGDFKNSLDSFPLIVNGHKVGEFYLKLPLGSNFIGLISTMIESIAQKLEIAFLKNENILLRNILDESQLKLELDKFELRFGTIFEQSPLSIQICSTEGKTLLVNPAWKKIWGISDEIIENYILKDYNMLEDPILEAQGVAQYIREGFAGNVTRVPIITYDTHEAGLGQSSKMVEGYIFPLRDKAGNVNEIVLIHIDVTEKEQLLAQLSLEKNQFETVLKNMPAGIIVIGKENNKILLSNEQMKTIQGSNSVGLHLGSEYIPTGFNIIGELIQPLDLPINRSLHNGEVISNEEIQYVNKLGQNLIISVSSAPILNAHGDIDSAVAVITDITLIKKTESQQNFLEKLTALLITTLDYEEIIIKIAEACVESIADGCIIDILEGSEIKRLVARHRDSDTQSYLDELQAKFPPTLDSPQPTARVIKSGEPELVSEVDLNFIVSRTFNKQHADLIKKIQLRSLIAVPIKIRGSIIGSINLVHTTERELFNAEDLKLAVEVARRAGLAIENSQLYSRAQKAIQQRDEFISIASHELKTPLTSMKLQLQLADRVLAKNTDGKIDASYFKKVTELSTKQIDRITVLVEDMLDIGRISSGKMGIKFQHENLSEVVKDSLLRLEGALVGLENLLTTDIQENVFADCDSFRIEQVLINLLTNAIRYGGNTTIKVTLTTRNQSVYLTVSDQGPGIDPIDHKRIFERFERAVSFSNISGLGLGLFISRQIMEQHMGTLSVESVPGKGSTFTACFPASTYLLHH
jgi:PAS domain S-box-containing protein